MSLVKWNPESSMFPAWSLSDWFDDFFQENAIKPAARGTTVPAVNIAESKDAFTLDVAAPGFQKDNFKLEVNNGYLAISGETKTSHESKDEKYARREYSYSTFTRSFTLPENVDGDHISANYVNGILKVTLPKTKTAEKAVKQIAVG